jgi:hypothetical protein
MDIVFGAAGDERLAHQCRNSRFGRIGVGQMTYEVGFAQHPCRPSIAIANDDKANAGLREQEGRRSWRGIGADDHQASRCD